MGAVHGLAAAAGARLSAPHGAVCAAALSAVMTVNLGALRERARVSPALPRFAELAVLLTGQADAEPEDGIEWLRRLPTRLEIPGLAHYGLHPGDIPPLAEAAQRASSMRGNPIELTDSEVAEIITRSL